MIHRVKFQNFKALRDVEITFDSRLTVLVGPNGSGKTSVLEGISFLCPGTRDISELVKITINLPNYRSSGTSPNDVMLEVFSQQPGGKEISFCYLPTAPAVGGRPNPNWTHPLCFEWKVRQPETKKWLNQVPPITEVPSMGAAALLRFDAAALASAKQPEQMPPSVQPDGTGLAATLGYLALNQPDQFETIIDEFKKVIPNIVRVRFDEQRTGGGTTKSLLFDFRGAKQIPGSFASNGTLYILGLLGVILGPRRPEIILFDDLDHGLHPKAQMQLVQLLRKLLDQYPDLQIIATSHSPYILDQLEWNEVRVTSLQDDGSATCVPLTDHPNVEKWKDAMSPGEFWSFAGEEWVKKTPAAVAP